MNSNGTPKAPDSLAEIARRQAQNYPVYFGDPHKDKLIRLVLTLAEDVCVLKDQLETAVLLNRNCTVEAIESFDVDEPLLEQRLARHSAYFEELLKELLPPESGT